MCHADGKGRHYDVAAAGVWVDCIHERRPVVHNDYSALQHRKGMPPGHATVVRELVVPVMRQGLIVSLLGVGNKATDYTNEDVEFVSRLADFAWDLVERRRAEIALSDNAARLRLALVATNQGMYDIDLTTGRASVSPEYAKMLGFVPDHFEEGVVSWQERLHPDDRARVTTVFNDYIAGKRPDYRVEFRQRTSSGEWKWVLSIGRIVERSADGTPIRLLGTHTDVTEAKQAEAALRLSEERHRHIAETSADWIWELDAEGRYSYASPRIRDLLGYEPAEIIGLEPSDLMAPADAERNRARVRNIIASRRPFEAFESVARHKSGRLVTVETNGVPFFDERGTLRGYRGMDRDITARRAAERQLRLHGAALAAAANAVVITNRDGVIEWANPAFTALSGWQLSEAIGKTPGQLVRSDRHDAEFFRRMWQTISQGRVWRGELVNRRKDGTLRHEDMTITPLTDEHGVITHYIAIKQDITERKQLEDQNRHAQRMESLGTMAGGIAHDLNNILSPVVMLSGLLIEDTVDPKARQLLTMVQRSGQRGASIIQQLLTFSRGSEAERLPMQLRHLLREIVTIMRETFPRNIDLSLEMPRALPLVSADATQIHQVLLNLCVNARDAMPSGGRLTLTAEDAAILAGDLRLPPGSQPGRYVVLSVSDTGQGIAPEIVDRIFDPFFTTKPVGKGTGLGLSTVQGIVRSHGGFVTVDSSPGRGSEFRVHLPALPGGDDALPPPVEAPSKAGQGQLILVVDDEHYIRAAVRMVLESDGYRVCDAINGEDALKQFERHRSDISLIVTDLMMPVLNGVELVREVRKLNETIPIIVMTGLSEVTDQRELGLVNDD